MTSQNKKYRILFYQLSIQPTEEVATPWQGLQLILQRSLPSYSQQNGMTREVWRPRTDLPAHRRHIFGQFRRFRNQDLPEIGAAGAEGRELEIDENEGLIEKNFFALFPRHNILAWHLNGHGSTPLQFARTLGDIWGCKVTAAPIIGVDALRRLMSGGSILKSLKVSLPRPTNPDLYPEADFSREVMRLLDGSGGDSLQVSIGVDTRRGDSRGGLVNTLKSAAQEFLTLGATNLKATLIEGDTEGCVDLISDRIQSVQEAETASRYPAATIMHQLIMNAREECDDEITAYFEDGEGERV